MFQFVVAATSASPFVHVISSLPLFSVPGDPLFDRLGGGDMKGVDFETTPVSVICCNNRGQRALYPLNGS